MSINNYFGTFKRKLKSDDVIDVENLYSDNDFVQLYNHLSTSEDYQDIELILDNITKNDRILEIGSGNGRVFNLLSENGYDIYGIEPEKEMSSYIKKEFRHKIYNIGIEKISDLIHLKLNKIIIPATTISLFSKIELENFLRDSKNLLSEKGSILFDFITVSNETIIGKMHKIKLEDKTYFYSNEFIDQAYIFNVYVGYGEVKKVGYSKKYLYDLTDIEEVSTRMGMKVRVIYCEKNYTFVEVSNE